MMLLCFSEGPSLGEAAPLSRFTKLSLSSGRRALRASEERLCSAPEDFEFKLTYRIERGPAAWSSSSLIISSRRRPSSLAARCLASPSSKVSSWSSSRSPPRPPRRRPAPPPLSRTVGRVGIPLYTTTKRKGLMRAYLLVI